MPQTLAPLPIAVGEPAPTFTQASAGNPRYAFDTAAGRYLLLCFLHQADPLPAKRALDLAQRRNDLFDDHHASFFAVSSDLQDEAQGRLQNRIPGLRVIWDHDLRVSRLYGAADDAKRRKGLWVLVDPRMRLRAILPFAADGSDVIQIEAIIAALPPPDHHAGLMLQAPVLYLPEVFDPALCRHLIGLYDAQGGTESGFMRAMDGRTVGVMDRRHKSRRDIVLEEGPLLSTIRNRIIRRVVPEIIKAHQFHVTRMERYIVSCYDSAEGGHFGAHRDNTTPATAHRRFAVSINLNDDFDGGEVRFPEYGSRSFKAPVGGAVVFSCSLLHAVSTVTKGRRYAFLPFLYDDAAARLRTANHARETASPRPDDNAAASGP